MRPPIRWFHFKIAMMVIGLSILTVGTCVALTDPAPATLPLARRQLARNQVMAVVIALDRGPHGDRTQDSSRLGRQVRRQWLRDRLRFSKPIADPTSLVQDAGLGRGAGPAGDRVPARPARQIAPGDPSPSRDGRHPPDHRLAVDARGSMVRGERAFRRGADRRPGAVGAVPGETGRLAGCRRPAARRDRELRGLLQRVELHLPARRRRRPSPHRRLARGDRALHALPATAARRTWASSGS